MRELSSTWKEADIELNGNLTFSRFGSNVLRCKIIAMFVEGNGLVIN